MRTITFVMEEDQMLEATVTGQWEILLCSWNDASVITIALLKCYIIDEDLLMMNSRFYSKLKDAKGRNSVNEKNM